MPRKRARPDSEGGRRKRTSPTGTSSAAYPTSRRDLWEPGGENPPGYPTVPQESDLISLQLLTVTLSSIIFMANGTTSEFSSLYSAISSRSSRFTTVPHQVRSGWVVLHRLPQAPYTQPPTVSAKLHQHTEPEMSPSCTAGRRGVRPHAACGQRHQSVLAYRAARAAYEDKLLPCYHRADVCLHLRLLYLSLIHI